MMALGSSPSVGFGILGLLTGADAALERLVRVSRLRAMGRRRLGRWNGGAVERWNGGAVERWNGGTVERWNGGTPPEKQNGTPY